MTGTTPDDDPRAYVQLAGIIRERIADGTIKADEFLSITDLKAEFGLARQTIAKSLRALAGEGLVARYPGYGYHVLTSPRDGKPALDDPRDAS
jgi:DNA-binding GntR family transcriptional regulator